ncbi:MAG: FAD-binding oxidoreductase [Alphaproteobacteria bacterium]
MRDEEALSSSLWAATATEPPIDAPPLDGTARADVAVVGAGYTGLAAALHLAQAGAAVRVIESREVGWGGSGRNFGQVIPGLKYDPDEIELRFGPELGARLIALAGGAADELFALVRRHGILCDAAQSGWIQPAHGARGLAIARGRVEQWAKRGADVEFLDRARAAALLGTESYAGGWLDRRGGQVQPLSLARGLARAAKEAGALIHGRSPVTRLERQGARWRVATAKAAVEADTVILATNAYTTRLWPGLRQSLIPVRPFVAASAPLGENVRRTILPQGHAASDSKRLLSYFRLDAQGRFLMGGRGALDHRAHSHLFDGLAADARRFFPQLGRVEWAYRWSGWLAMTADHMPHLHALAPGLYAGLGYQGRGLALALVFGRELARRALHGDTIRDGWPVTPLRPLPFHALRGPALRGIRLYWRLCDRLDG